ncbi:sigma-70 family RNA polymerase sigma factor [Treponema brennaborense]|uniref:RNA polymerase sigma factor n=1 Tax=Treponema brennaborense (strain DSM 12168 / CIP 105900 / DD5/3) TaxID=906968 RepID=F4LIQ5_TREBD|nr:RNA polymerase sigma factor RpoD/SigA [Treponema brennaborense]AEE16230.1 RNA polymerase, sigma 70 subunit, RpoD subfamily [Treponema brennaborense DSM 12168]
MATVKNYTMASDDNVLALYLKEINKIPLLSREEETDLAVKAAAGDKAAKDRIVNANLRFVVNVAKKYQNHGLDLVDLISEGNIGLMTAIERFDVSKGYHFISYAVWWIRQSILKAICEKSRMIRLPLNRANELVQIEHARKLVAQDKTEEEEITEVADMLNMDVSHVREMLNISRDMISLDASIRSSDQDSASIGEFLEDSRYEDPADTVLNASMQDDIDGVLGTLTDKEADVLRYRFGLNGNKSMSLKEVGDKFNLTKERIRQIEKKAIKRLQHPARTVRLEAYVA